MVSSNVVCLFIQGKSKHSVTPEGVAMDPVDDDAWGDTINLMW